MKTFYQLTYFDTSKNERLKYLNGTSWQTAEEAEAEWVRIMKQEALNAKNLYFSSRSKWAIEAIRNKKRRLVKTLR